MFGILINRIARILGSRPATSRSNCVRRASLSVESMESRLVPSTSPVGVVALPPAVPAHVGASAPVVPITPASETGGIIPIAPERPVHGYKWRSPWPRTETNDGEAGAMMQSQAAQHIAAVAVAHALAAQSSSVPWTSPLI